MLADLKLTPPTAQWLVNDVALRLDRQNYVCRVIQTLIDQERQSFLQQKHNPYHHPDNSKPSNDARSSALPHPRIIRAVVQDFRKGKAPLQQRGTETTRQHKEDHRSKNKADYTSTLKSLQNLLRLHSDTHRLCSSTELPPLVFQRWSRADQHLVFTTMEQIRARHANTIETWADIVVELRAIHPLTTCCDPLDNDHHRDQKLLFHNIERVLQGRWGIQLLCDHYVALHKTPSNDSNNNNNNMGAVRNCSMRDMIQDAVMQSRQICEAHYEEAPEVVIQFLSSKVGTGIRDCKKDDVDVLAVHAWLYHVLLELLKNAMDATLKKHWQSSSPNTASIPPIYIHVERRDEYIVVDIHDQGIGLLPPNKQHVQEQQEQNDNSTSNVTTTAPNPTTFANAEWAFGFTNSSSMKRWDRLEEQQSYAMVRSPVSSLGVGLHVSRTMMRYFGGNVELLHRPANEDMDVGCTVRVWLNTNTDVPEQQLLYEEAENKEEGEAEEKEGDEEETTSTGIS